MKLVGDMMFKYCRARPKIRITDHQKLRWIISLVRFGLNFGGSYGFGRKIITVAALYHRCINECKELKIYLSRYCAKAQTTGRNFSTP